MVAAGAAEAASGAAAAVFFSFFLTSTVRSIFGAFEKSKAMVEGGVEDWTDGRD